MSHPRIAVFARLAKGNAAPVRAIEGQATKIARTMHGIAYDEVHDEVVVTNPFAEAILFFRGGAHGEEAPLRIIQGPSTHLNSGQGATAMDTLAVDPQHGEVFVPLIRGAILVFPRTGNGDTAPLRILRGPKTQLRPTRVAVDPVNDLLVVANSDPEGLLIFNRTDSGDVAPRAIITGPKAGIVRPQAVQVDPERRHIIVAVRDEGHGADHKPGSIAVWNYADNGDVPPKAAIKGPASRLIRPRGIALNPKNKEIYVVDMVRNALFTYSFPAIF